MTNSSNNSNGFTITRVCGTTGKVLGTRTMSFPTFAKKGARSATVAVAFPCTNCGSVHSSLSNADDCCKVAKLQAKADALQANIDGLKADRDALAALIDAVS